MDSPAMVAMPLPMCRRRSGSFALQGTSLEEQGFEVSLRLLPLILVIHLQNYPRSRRDTNGTGKRRGESEKGSLRIRTANTIK